MMSDTCLRNRLSSLPDELLYPIFSFVVAGHSQPQRPLRPLCLLSRTLGRVAQTFLYQDVQISKIRHLRKLACTIAARPEFGALVQQLTICLERGAGQTAAPFTSNEEAAAFCLALANVEHISLSSQADPNGALAAGLLEMGSSGRENALPHLRKVDLQLAAAQALNPARWANLMLIAPNINDITIEFDDELRDVDPGVPINNASLRSQVVQYWSRIQSFELKSPPSTRIKACVAMIEALPQLSSLALSDGFRGLARGSIGPVLDMLHLPKLESLKLQPAPGLTSVCTLTMSTRFSGLKHLEIEAPTSNDVLASPLPALLESLHLHPPVVMPLISGIRRKLTFDQVHALLVPGPNHLPDLKLLRLDGYGLETYNSHLKRTLVGMPINNEVDSKSRKWTCVDEAVTRLPRSPWAKGWTYDCFRELLALATRPGFECYSVQILVDAELAYWEEVAKYAGYEAALEAGAIQPATTFRKWKQKQKQKATKRRVVEDEPTLTDA